MKKSLDTAVQTQTQTILKKREQVGILGGTFNPPHIGHLVMADQVYQQLGLDRLYFMPDYLPPHVTLKQTIEAHHRLKMVELAIQGHPDFYVEDCEIKRGGKSYTVDTMRELVEKNPEIDYYFIIGGDMVADLPNWHKIDELMQLVQFVGVARLGFEKKSPYPIIWVDSPSLDISSTLLREKIMAGCVPIYLIPEKVIAYIQEKELYRR